MGSKAIRLHDRDLWLLTELGAVGLLDTETIRRRFFPADTTGRACLRRLRLLSRHGFTRPMPLPYAFGSARGGRQRAVHGLTPHGADVLHELTGLQPPRVWRKDPRPERIPHYLAVARFQLALGDASHLRGLPAPGWISEHDLKPGAIYADPASERYMLCRVFPQAEGSSISCRPDASFLVRVPAHGGAAGKAVELIGYLEADRSTETLSKISTKLPGYEILLSTGAYRSHWPETVEPMVRLFFVVPSEERLENIAATVAGHAVAPFVRLATAADLAPESLLTAAIWRTPTGERRSILRPAGVAA